MSLCVCVCVRVVFFAFQKSVYIATFLKNYRFFLLGLETFIPNGFSMKLHEKETPVICPQ